MAAERPGDHHLAGEIHGPSGVDHRTGHRDVYHWGPLMAAAFLGSIKVTLVYSFFVERYVAVLSGA